MAYFIMQQDLNHIFLCASLLPVLFSSCEASLKSFHLPLSQKCWLSKKERETKVMDLGSWGGGKNQRLIGRVEPSDCIVGKVFVSIKQKKITSQPQ